MQDGPEYNTQMSTSACSCKLITSSKSCTVRTSCTHVFVFYYLINISWLVKRLPMTNDCEMKGVTVNTINHGHTINQPTAELWQSASSASGLYTTSLSDTTCTAGDCLPTLTLPAYPLPPWRRRLSRLRPWHFFCQCHYCVWPKWPSSAWGTDSIFISKRKRRHDQMLCFTHQKEYGYSAMPTTDRVD